MAEGENGDLVDVVVLEGQFAEAARQIHGDLGKQVVGKVQGFQRTGRKHREILNSVWDKFTTSSTI